MYRQRILGLRYEPRAGYAVFDLDEGELWVSANAEGAARARATTAHPLDSLEPTP